MRALTLSSVPWSDDEPRGRSFSTHPRDRTLLTREERRRLCESERSIAACTADALSREAQLAAVLARRGSDLSSYHFEEEVPQYTHLAIAVREAGEWWVHHLLNTHSGPNGHLYRQPLIDFFRDDPLEYRACVMVPSRSLQRRLVAVVASRLRDELYTPSYSRVAYPFSKRYMNSNQWVAELVAAAQANAHSRDAAQAELRRRGLRPDALLGMGPMRQLASYWLTRNTRLDDHPVRNRLAGRFEFLLEPALRHYLLATDDLRAIETVELPPARPMAHDSQRAPSA